MKKTLLSLILVLSIVVAKAQNAAIDKVTASYIGVKNALVASNATLAKSRSAELVTALSHPIKGLKPSQQKLLATYLDKLKFDSRHISQTTVIDHQREHFGNLSKNMYSLLSGLKLNGTTIYQQYCPMKKAAWLSESEDIRNPYYGDDMLECGKVTATLKAVK
ncbi:DUF3347 domain-containing protein [Mucilaginibacter sp. RB4R14]|uniref:DUF3347 domain-containing protein n=1 Tax=Mucilaginibacter aurantiaciroseus TaxID=2949308 RepID=UPI00209123A3|nr:DUF3347 domain-containing protein [Mucilaginibacter aurantiaciroseus]MCO5935537.1 DUF3347 domain-containing protein [Mucilaginibacter aurantiaciroseus]